MGCDEEDRIDAIEDREISIHAPIVGCDLLLIKELFYKRYISIHAPIVGCDLHYSLY